MHHWLGKESEIGSDMVAPFPVVAVRSMLTLPCEAGSDSLDIVNVACHLPGPILTTDATGVPGDVPSDRAETFVVVIAEIVIGWPAVITVGCTCA